MITKPADHRFKPDTPRTAVGHSQTVAIALLTLSATACQPPAGTYRSTLYVFGTLVEVSIDGLTAEQANTLTARVSRELQRRHRAWHAWQSGGLTAINEALARGEDVPIDAELAALLRAAQALEQASGGRFNPTIGRLVALWGFHTDDYPVMAPPPSEREVAAALAQTPSADDLSIEDNRLRSANRAVVLDLGGIAKGAAVDAAVQMIKDAGASGAIVDAGGDLRTFGTHGGEPWQIQVRDPRGGSQASLGVIATSTDQSIFTSGNYLRYREDGDRRWGHIIDPRSGWPVEHVVSATVIADNGTLADAAATSLVVAGPDQWRDVAAQMGIEAALIMDSNGCLAMTEAMSRRIELTSSAPCALQPSVSP